MTYVWGIVFVAIGVLVMKYSFFLVQTFGKIPFAENKLGGGMGGTYALYKIVGIVIIFCAMLYMFGGARILVGPILPMFVGK